MDCDAIAAANAATTADANDDDDDDHLRIGHKHATPTVLSS
jgi:hypothetical protein